MNYLITLEGKIDFAPETETLEILQNIRTILATVIGSVPLDRNLGISLELLDKPLPVARLMMKQAIIEAIEDGEPRAKLQKVDFEQDTKDAMEGIFKPRVIVSIGEEFEEMEEA